MHLAAGMLAAAAVLALALPGATVDPVCFRTWPGSTADRDAAAAASGAEGKRPQFFNVATEAGIRHSQGPLRTAPQCLFHDWHLMETIREVAAQRDTMIGDYFDRGELEAGLLWDKGAHCMAERMSGSAAVGDFDADGFPDIFASRSDGPPVLYRNRGDGTFVDVSGPSGIAAGMGHALAQGASWVDTTNSGRLDLMVTTIASDRYYFFANNGDGTFTECADERGLAVIAPSQRNKNFTLGQSIAVGDFDRDGYLDLFVGEWAEFVIRTHSEKKMISHSRLLRNRGGDKPGFFVDETQKRIGRPRDLLWNNPKIPQHLRKATLLGVYTFSPAFVDLDNDGWPDLTIASDFGTTQILWNNQGTFKRRNNGACCDDQNGMGSTFSDVDNDGKFDWFVGGIHDDRPVDPLTPFGVSGNRLYRNEGVRAFSDLTDTAGVRKSYWSWGSAFLDYDNDGDEDLYVVNGFVMPESTVDDPWNITPNQLFEKQDGLVNFTEVAVEVGLDDRETGRGVAVLDFDADGDLDVFVVIHGGPPMLYRNDGGHDNDWLRVRVVEAEGGRDSIGATVLVEAPELPPQRRIIGLGAHLMAQSETVAHFGLGQLPPDARVSVTVTWPPTSDEAPAVSTVVQNVAPNAVLHIVKPEETPDVAVDATESVHECGDGVRGVATTRAAATAAQAWAAQTSPTVTINDTEALNMTTDTLPPKIVKDLFGPLLEAIDLLVESDAATAEVRQADGRGNHRDGLGAAFTPLCRKSPAAYGSDGATPANPELASARSVSNVLFAQTTSIPSRRRLSEVNLHFGQLLAHDTDHTTPQPNALLEENFPIAVEQGDVVFDPNGTGHEVIRFRRSIYTTGPDGVREQINKVTSFVDASVVYGSDAARESALRSGVDGRLRVSVGNLLPLNRAGLMNDNPLARPVRSLFVAGDARANIQPGLTALHTVWHREHNWLAGKVKAALAARNKLPTDPVEADERIFQLAKKLLIAEFQIVSYKEYLTSIVGDGALEPYAGYDLAVNPAICNEFSTAVFRFGHSQANDNFTFQGTDGFRVKETDTVLFGVPLAEFYFLPAKIQTSGGLDALLRQMPFELAQEIDSSAVDGVRNMLFGARAAGGSDLLATNVQRGRDHGVPGYNELRRAYGLEPAASHEAISSSPHVVAKLRALYKTVDDVDALAGGLAEDHVEGASVGELFRTALIEQFQRLRDGDRFWYERAIEDGGVGPEIAALLESVTTMGGVLVRNVDMLISTVEQMTSLTDDGGDPRQLAATMAKSNVMFAPKNPFLWAGGCAADSDCPDNSFCQDMTKGPNPQDDFLWTRWCAPCAACPDYLEAQGVASGSCSVRCSESPKDEL